jgi:hypothetical protein
MLASVANAAEAGVVVQLGADVIDLKDARRGALGAVPLDAARQVIGAVAGQSETSAALGDPPYDEEALRRAHRRWRRWASITSSSPWTHRHSIVSAILWVGCARRRPYRHDVRRQEARFRAPR